MADLTLEGAGSGVKRRSRELTPLQRGYHGTPELAENRKRQDFFIKPFYKNDLPDIPCEPKHIVLPIDWTVLESPTSELKKQLYEQVPDYNCGVSVDLVTFLDDWKELEGDENWEMHPVDKQLLEDEVEPGKNMKRTNAHSKSVPWLRRTEYISSEVARFRTKKGDKVEFRVDEAINRKLKMEAEKFDCLRKLSDKDARMKWIEQSFEDVNNAEIKHPSDPNAVPLEVIPIFPDFELWKHAFLEVVFDPSPGNQGKVNEDQMKSAFLHVISYDDEDDSVEKLGYFVPNEGKAISECVKVEPEVKFQFSRDYIFKNSSNSSMSSTSDTYVFMEKDDQIAYCGLDKKIFLNRPIKLDTTLKESRIELCVNYRPLSDSEINIQNEREDVLRFNCKKDTEGTSSVTRPEPEETFANLSTPEGTSASMAEETSVTLIKSEPEDTGTDDYDIVKGFGVISLVDPSED